MALRSLLPALFSTLVSALLLPALGCGTVDPEAAHATAGCEPATSTELATGPTMLPGRACLNCHTESGQAGDSDVRWTAAGTVFGSITAACNTGGIPGVNVDILDQDGKIQVSLTTNSVGNFYTQVPLKFPLRARLSKDGKMQEMTELQVTGNCHSCHAQPPANTAPGRLFLN